MRTVEHNTSPARVPLCAPHVIGNRMGTVTDQPVVAASVLEWDGLRLSMRTETDGDVVMPSPCP